MVLKVYLKILLIAPFSMIEFLIIFDNWVFEKGLQDLETCVLVKYNLCGKLVSSLEVPITFDERFKVTLVPFSNLLSCELYNLTFKVIYWVIFYWYYFNKISLQYSHSSMWKFYGFSCFFNNDKYYCVSYSI